MKNNCRVELKDKKKYIKIGCKFSSNMSMDVTPYFLFFGISCGVGHWQLKKLIECYLKTRLEVFGEKTCNILSQNSQDKSMSCLCFLLFFFFLFFNKGQHPYPGCHKERPTEVCGWVGKLCGRFCHGSFETNTFQKILWYLSMNMFPKLLFILLYKLSQIVYQSI